MKKVKSRDQITGKVLGETQEVSLTKIFEKQTADLKQAILSTPRQEIKIETDREALQVLSDAIKGRPTCWTLEVTRDNTGAIKSIVAKGDN
jgi:hypothetical protein